MVSVTPTRVSLIRVFAFCASFMAAGCTLFATRPTQEMSDTNAAIKAAREVQADTLAPELYRQANEWFFRAKQEFKFKNYSIAREYTEKARFFAEQAEFEAIRSGGSRNDASGLVDPLANMQAPAAPPDAAQPPPKKPYEYPTPTGTPYSEPSGKP